MIVAVQVRSVEGFYLGKQAHVSSLKKCFRDKSMTGKYKKETGKEDVSTKDKYLSVIDQGDS